MTTIALRPELEDRLRPAAERHQTTIEELANEWLETQLWQEWHKAIEEESARFQTQHAELLIRYAGEHIAMREGVVIDHDADLVALHQRVRARYGDEPILITPVQPQPAQRFRILSPRRQRT